MAENITTPVGRLIGGDLYEPETKDYEGKPLLNKDGSARVNYQFGLAIPKSPGVTHWANEPGWGQKIWMFGNSVFTNGETQRHDFAWKITDGDSQIPNKRGRKPCEREGYPGHWVIWFSGGYAPTIYNADGSQKILEKDAVKPGYYVQVFGNIGKNTGASPGLYVNHTYVALVAYGAEIQVGPDVSAAGFGQNVSLPPGATLAPVGGAFNPAPPPPAVNAPPVSPPPTAPAQQVAVAPNPGILTPPVGAGAPPPPPPPAASAPVGHPNNAKLTTKANGYTYEQLIGSGWSDAQLIAEGVMLP